MKVSIGIATLALIVACVTTNTFLVGTEPAKGLVSLPPENQQFIRLKSEGDDPAALQTAITRYQRPLDQKEGSGEGNVTVDLIAAVHIGEGKYYANLNELFTDYDAVLYELVAERGTRVPQGGRGGGTNPISFLQQSARSVLGLESQLDKVDYTKINFVHADLSPEQLLEKMQQRGDTALSLAMESMAQIFKASSEQEATAQDITLQEMLETMSDPLKAKRFMARQFATPNQMELGLGKSLNQLLIKDRNQAAASVLKQQLESGKKKIAIFYGAAHMPDLEERLEQQFGFKRSAQSWLTAWDLTQSHAKPADGPMSMLMKLLEEMDK